MRIGIHLLSESKKPRQSRGNFFISTALTVGINCNNIPTRSDNRAKGGEKTFRIRHDKNF